MKSYIELLKLPGVTRLMSSQLVGRFQYGLVSVAFLLFFHDKFDSYAVASIALAAETIGVGISSPILGRKFASWGIRKTILLCVLATALLQVLIITVEMDAWVAVALSGVMGFATPPLQQASRTTYDDLVGQKHIKTMFSFDAISQEAIWIIGPVLATVLFTQVSPAAPIWAMCFFNLFGGLWFLTHPAVKRVTLEQHEEKLGRVLKHSSLRWMMTLGALLVAGFSGVEIGTVGAVDAASAGLALAMFSIGSVIGGIAFGHKAHSKWAILKFAAIVVFGYSLVLISPANAIWLGFCWLVAGAGVAPMLGTLSHLISISLPPNQAAEAYGWMGTGQLIGYSAAASVCGFALEFGGATLTFIVAIILGLATVLAALASRNLLPVPDGK